jgi:hypothetical protein
MAVKVERNSFFGKRKRIINAKECEFELRDTLIKIKECFNQAVSISLQELRSYPLYSRARGLEAAILNSNIIKCIQETFPLNWKFGKYKRFMLRINGYIILFKKLNTNDMPMNIATTLIKRIENQLQGNLFGSSDNGIDPIVFFGYRKYDLILSYVPKLVYIDEGKVKWKITVDDIDSYSNFKEMPNIKVAQPNRGVHLKNKETDERNIINK